jgi:HEAT repeat protein
MIMAPGTTLAAMLADLVHPDKNVRIEAALELGKLADPAAIPALLARLGDEPDFFVRENVTWALVRMSSEAVLPLIDVLVHGDAAARFNAAHTLSKLADARAVPALLAACDAPDQSLAQKAVFALGRIGDLHAVPALVARLGAGSQEMRGAAATALESFGDAAVPALLEAFRAGDVAVRVDLTEILGAIGGEASSSALAGAMDDEAWEVRFAAVNAMRQSSSAQAVAALERAAADAHPTVRLVAARVLPTVVAAAGRAGYGGKRLQRPRH